jgi:3-oxoacyl-[acyl-carrier protein] reductase
MLLENGYSVVGCSRRAAQLEREGFQHVAADASTESGVKAVMQAADAIDGQLEALVINMAVGSAGLLATLSQEELTRVMRTNLIGPALLSGQALRRMMKRRYGRLVGIGSIRTYQPVVGAGAYAISKAGLQQLVRQVAIEGGPYGITANMVSISLLTTGMAEALSDDQKQSLLKGCVLPRPCAPSDVCNAVEFFLRPSSSFVTGQALRLGFL